MIFRACLPLLLLGSSVPALRAADAVFPGLQAVLTLDEWQRAGLDRLTSDQLGVIDAALVRHLRRQPEPVSETPIPKAPAPAAAPPPGLFARFGLTRPSGPDWRSQPPLEARATGWLTVNRFTLDNGQVWEGAERIPFDVAGREIVIEARPGEAFVVRLKSGSAPIRVRRVK